VGVLTFKAEGGDPVGVGSGCAFVYPTVKLELEVFVGKPSLLPKILVKHFLGQIIMVGIHGKRYDFLL
jgi:hypothetical protein